MKKKKNLKKTFKKNKEKIKGISLWLKILIIFCSILIILNSFSSVITIIISLLCAYKCSKWAKEINKSINWAYAAVFFLGLLGLLIYWLYYRNKKKKINH